MPNTRRTCGELLKLIHVVDVAIQNTQGKAYQSKLIFKPKPQYNYCPIEIFLEVDADFFLENNLPFKRPKTLVYCENCDSAFHQMTVIISGETNEDWRARTFMELTMQLY